MIANLDDPAIHPKLIQDMTDNLRRRGGADTLLITSAPESQAKSIVGKTLAQIATERHESPLDAAIQILKAGGSSVASFNMKESDIEAFMRQPWVMTCSDGSTGHPRKYGTFPRKFHEYVFTRHVITLEEAVHRSSALPAETLQLKDRGLLKPGYFADVLVFDPKTYADHSTYIEPEIISTGVRFLTVNGHLAIDNGALTPTLAGKALAH